MPGKKQKGTKRTKINLKKNIRYYSSPPFLCQSQIQSYSTRNGWVASISSKLNSVYSLAYVLPFFFDLSKLYHCTQLFSFIIECETESRTIKAKQNWKTSLFYFSATSENLFSQKITMAFFLTFLPWYASIVYSVKLSLDISTHW